MLREGWKEAGSPTPHWGHEYDRNAGKHPTPKCAVCSRELQSRPLRGVCPDCNTLAYKALYEHIIVHDIPIIVTQDGVMDWDGRRIALIDGAEVHWPTGEYLQECVEAQTEDTGRLEIDVQDINNTIPLTDVVAIVKG